MIRVCCYLKLNLNRNILNTKPFSRDICGLRYWNTNFDISSICSWFSYLFKFKGQKNLNNENFDNIFETLVTLISKWPGISVWVCEFVCSYSGKNFKKKKSLRAHVHIHTDTSGKHCSYCEKNFKNKNPLRVHKYRSHEQSEHCPSLDTPPHSPINGNVRLAVKDTCVCVYIHTILYVSIIGQKYYCILISWLLTENRKQ